MHLSIYIHDSLKDELSAFKLLLTTAYQTTYNSEIRMLCIKQFRREVHNSKSGNMTSDWRGRFIMFDEIPILNMERPDKPFQTFPDIFLPKELI